jgi:hypothetical protein
MFAYVGTFQYVLSKRGKEESFFFHHSLKALRNRKKMYKEDSSLFGVYRSWLRQVCLLLLKIEKM